MDESLANLDARLCTEMCREIAECRIVNESGHYFLTLGTARIFMNKKLPPDFIQEELKWPEEKDLFVNRSGH